MRDERDEEDLREFIARMDATLPAEVLESDASLVLIVQEACRRVIGALGALHNARHFVAQVDESFRHTDPADTRAGALHRGVVLAEEQVTRALRAYGVDLPSCPLDDPAYRPTFDNTWPAPPAPRQQDRAAHLSLVPEMDGDSSSPDGPEE